MKHKISSYSLEQMTPLCINADISRDSLIDKMLIKGKVKAMKHTFQNIAPIIPREGQGQLCIFTHIVQEQTRSRLLPKPGVMGINSGKPMHHHKGYRRIFQILPNSERWEFRRSQLLVWRVLAIFQTTPLCNKSRACKEFPRLKV